MTLIAALIDRDGAVWLGGDSAASGGGRVYIRRDAKVWGDKEMVLGFAGSFRARDLLRYHTDIIMPTPDADLDTYMRTTFIDTVKQSFREGGFTHKGEGQEAAQATVIVGIRGRIFVVQNDFAIGESNHDFNVIGSGSSEALGSLYATRGNPDPKARLEEALDAAVFFVSSVRPPYQYVKTEVAS